MRVNSVSCVYRTQQCNRRNIKKSVSENPDNSEINFKSKFGAIVGGTLGTGAFLVGSFFLAPAAACLSGIGLLAGMVGGSELEDKINKSGNYEEKKNDKKRNDD